MINVDHIYFGLIRWPHYFLPQAQIAWAEKSVLGDKNFEAFKEEYKSRGVWKVWYCCLSPTRKRKEEEETQSGEEETNLKKLLLWERGKSEFGNCNGCDKDAANLFSTNRESGGSSSRASQHRRQLQQSRQRHSQARRRRLARLLLQRHRRRHQQLRRYGSDLSLFFFLQYLGLVLFIPFSLFVSFLWNYS